MEYTNKYPNVKKIVASKNARDAALTIFNDLKKENIYISPSGVVSEKELTKNKNSNTK